MFYILPQLMDVLIFSLIKFIAAYNDKVFDFLLLFFINILIYTVAYLFILSNLLSKLAQIILLLIILVSLSH
jgi:hypothetical protein